MRTFLITLALIASSVMLTAQTNLIEDLKQATNSYLAALVDADVDYLLSTVHPNILEMGGGNDFLRKDVVSDLEMFRNSGVIYKSGKALDPSESHQVGANTYYVVPHEWTAELGTHNYKSTQYVLANSDDEGKTWSFINLSKYSAKNLAVYIPGFDENIEFPLGSPFESID